jgi:hyperosmotically inducible periplasmic protein
MKALSAFALSLGLIVASASLSAADNKTAGERMDDTKITARVKTELADNDAVKARQINVETHAGIVQLSGFVDSSAAKDAAATAARNVPGVMQVKNDLIVKEGERSAGRAVDDTVIAAKVKTQLAGKSGLGTASDVNVEVNSGIVELSGFVATNDQKSRAGEIARSVSGVKDVRNNIELKKPAS